MGKRKKPTSSSRLMKGGPVTARSVHGGPELDDHLHDVLAECTCTPVFHAHDDPEHGAAVAILHEHDCARLVRLRAEQS